MRGAVYSLTIRCPTTKSQLNALAEKISRGLAVYSEYSWLEHIASAAEDWNGIHRLCRRLANKPAPIRPLLASDGTIRYRAEDRAEIFADHLEMQFSPNPSDNHQQEADIGQRLADIKRLEECYGRNEPEISCTVPATPESRVVNNAPRSFLSTASRGKSYDCSPR
ncbi:hypothetical protein MSG28_002303 [Choristoneura fumiferana]|uniref:Uncharacterized protein n=1 Tax=Choristoneura fumiferana TaxID=7141 RepID=A0ACC0JV04_CHOFU|nr:hypothetical protein MSG28_002303 [Choristoneura fumiferana]